MPKPTGGSSTLRSRVDLLFGTIFLLAAVRWVLIGQGHSVDLSITLSDSRFWLVGLVGGLFFVSLGFHPLRMAQPFVFLFISAIPFFQSPESIFGFSLFAVGAIMLYVDGHMRHRPILKMLLLGTYLFFLIIVATVVTVSSLEQATGVILFMAGFFLYLFFTFQDKIIVFVKAEKPVIHLERKGLTTKEVAHLMALLGGRTIKEIAWDYGVKDSTVRNSLARAYHKLGFTDKVQLLQWAGDHSIRP